MKPTRDEQAYFCVVTTKDTLHRMSVLLYGVVVNSYNGAVLAAPCTYLLYLMMGHALQEATRRPWETWQAYFSTEHASIRACHLFLGGSRGPAELSYFYFFEVVCRPKMHVRKKLAPPKRRFQTNCDKMHKCKNRIEKKCAFPIRTRFCIPVRVGLTILLS